MTVAVLTKPKKLTRWLPTRAKEHAPAWMTTTTQHSREDFDSEKWGSEPLEVDEAACVIRNVKIIGTDAKNLGRKYPQHVLEACQAKYQGAKVNYNHIKRGQETHDLDDRFGWIENVHPIQGRPGLFGDLHYNPKHPRAGFVIDYAKRKPEMLGMSPDHFFIEVDNKGQTIPRGSRYDGPRSVVQILHVQSVDLVADPSTTNGLQEAEIMDHLDTPAIPAEGEGMDSIDHLREHCCKMVEETLAGITDPDQLRKASAKIESMLGKLGKLGKGTEEEEAEEEDETEKASKKNEEPMDVKKEEEALRTSKDPTVKALLRQLDAQRVQESATAKKLADMEARDAKIVADAAKRSKAVQHCREAVKLPKDGKETPHWATDIFLDQLVEVNETAWPKLVADRVAIAGAKPGRIGAASHAREGFEGYSNPPIVAPTEPAKPKMLEERKAIAAELQKSLMAGAR